MRSDSPIDRVDPPKIPSETYTVYLPNDAETVVEAGGRSAPITSETPQ